MNITAKTRSYNCNEDGSHRHRDGKYAHRVAGPAWVRYDYDRVWYNKDHIFSCFRETGPGITYLGGASYNYRINGKCCSERQYEDYCKNQKL